MSRRPIRWLTSALVLSFLASAWLGWDLYAAYQGAQEAERHLAQQERLYGVILRLDEVLTMSARLAAALGETRWEDRYHAAEPELDAAIQAARATAPAEVRLEASQVDEANRRLIALESKAFGLVRADRVAEARMVLFTPEYEEQKRTYKDGMDRFIAGCREHIASAVTAERRAVRTRVAIMLGILIALIAGAAWVTRRRVATPLGELTEAAGRIAGGDLGQPLTVTSDDEIGALQEAFNGMAAELRAQRDLLEQQNRELSENLLHQQRLAETIRELAIPLIPVTRDVVVLPVVGYVDTRRASELMQKLLEGSVIHEARTAILDVTGISALDSHVLQFLMRAIQAAGLMGTTVAIAGISAAMAQTLVEQGLELPQVRTYRDLRSALEITLKTGAGRAPAAPARR